MTANLRAIIALIDSGTFDVATFPRHLSGSTARAIAAHYRRDAARIRRGVDLDDGRVEEVFRHGVAGNSMVLDWLELLSGKKLRGDFVGLASR